jgi:hypothetical protein
MPDEIEDLHGAFPDGGTFVGLLHLHALDEASRDTVEVLHVTG